MTVQTVGDQQAQYLKEALQVVRIQSKLMRQCLVGEFDLSWRRVLNPSN